MRRHYPLNSNGDEDAGQLPWIDGVPSTGVQGSYPGHAIVTDTEAEILAAIDAAGLARSGNDLTQLLQSISRGIWVGQFGGTGAALTATLPNGVVLPGLLAGMRVRGIAASNYPGGGGTLKITGVGSAAGVVSCPIVGADGVSLLGGGSWVPGQFLSFDIDGSGNARFSGGTPAGGYTPIYAARTYYVDVIGGSDLNDGLTQSTALATGNAFIAKVGTLNLNGNTVTGRFLDAPAGTPHAPVTASAPFFGNGRVVLQGNLTSAANCNIATSSGNAISATGGAALDVQGFQPATTDAIGSCVSAQFGGTINLIGPMNFTAGGALSHISASDGGQVRLGAGYTINGNAQSHWSVARLGRIYKYAGVQLALNLLNTPYFSYYFAVAQGGAEIFVPNMTFSGACAAARYYAYTGGNIDTGSGNPNYLPGNAAGSAPSGYYS